jgi:pilus assembly protein Flp/PilA
MWHAVHNFLDDQAGVTSIEYALLASLIGVAIVTTVTAVGTNLSGSFANIGTAIAGTIGG